MTATADIITLGCSDDLPDLASDPRVVVAYDMTDECDTCSVCLESGETIHEGVYYVSFDRYGLKGCRTYLCGPEHGQSELVWLLRPRLDAITNIVLHVPPKFLPSGPRGSAGTTPIPVDPEQDELFLFVDSLLLFIKDGMPNTATVDMSGRDGFTHAANTLLAHISQLGLNRIQQLGRTA